MSVHMTISGISSAVQAILVATDEFSTVLNHAPTSDENFDGYPAVFHYYNSAESNFATVSQNRRIIEYVVEVWIQSVAATESEKYLEAYTLMDTLMDVFDQAIDLNNACDIMRPTPSNLERVALTEGEGFRAEIRLFCEADITFRDS